MMHKFRIRCLQILVLLLLLSGFVKVGKQNEEYITWAKRAEKRKAEWLTEEIPRQRIMVNAHTKEPVYTIDIKICNMEWEDIFTHIYQMMDEIGDEYENAQTVAVYGYDTENYWMGLFIAPSSTYQETRQYAYYYQDGTVYEASCVTSAEGWESICCNAEDFKAHYYFPSGVINAPYNEKPGEHQNRYSAMIICSQNGKLFTYYDEIYNYHTQERVLACDYDNGQLSVTVSSREKDAVDDKEADIHRFTLKEADSDTADIFEKNADAKEARSIREYFASQHPDMEDFAVYYPEEEGDADSCFVKFRDIKDDKVTDYGYFMQDNAMYEAVGQSAVPEKSDLYETQYGYAAYHSYNYEIDELKRRDNYEDDEAYAWHREVADSWESVTYQDMEIDAVNGIWSCQADIGIGEPVSFYARKNGTHYSGDFSESDYELTVSAGREGKPIQKINDVSVTYGMDNIFSLEDFNGDGILDLCVKYYYGANGGTASHYVWSQSEERYVKLPSDLDYYGMYSVSPEERRLYMHYHGSAVDGTETTYQWSGEMDYSLIKEFYHGSGADDTIKIEIWRMKDDRKEVLSNYAYSYEEYQRRSDEIGGIYYLDFTEDISIANPDTGETLVIRYAQNETDDFEDKNEAVYVFCEDTYLQNVILSSTSSPFHDMIWSDGRFVISYEDGTAKEYGWDELTSGVD